MSDPPETDLDYYSRPENYTGSNLQSLQKFTYAKQKQDKALSDQNKKAKKKKSGFDLFARYKHILKGYVSDEEEDDEGEDLEEEKDDASKKTKFEEIKEESEETDKNSEENGDQKKTEPGVLPSSAEKPHKSPGDMDRLSADITSPLPPGLEPTPSPRDGAVSTSPVPPKPRGQPDVSGGRSSVSLRFTKQQQIAKELQAKAVSVPFLLVFFFSKRLIKIEIENTFVHFLH